MKYKLLKKIGGLTIGDSLQVGDTFQDGTSVTFLIGNNTAQTRMLSPLDLHNLLLNGTIEKVEENERWRAEEGWKYYTFSTNSKWISVTSFIEREAEFDDNLYGNYNSNTRL